MGEETTKKSENDVKIEVIVRKNKLVMNFGESGELWLGLVTLLVALSVLYTLLSLLGWFWRAI